jgi:hypothetical protein
LNIWVHLQEDGTIYRYSTVCFTCQTHYTIPVCGTVFLKMNPRVRNT